MMKLTITIKMGNAAFEGDDCSFEVARILTQITDRIAGDSRFGPGWAMPLFDVNGNKIGTAEVSE